MRKLADRKETLNRIARDYENGEISIDEARAALECCGYIRRNTAQAAAQKLEKVIRRLTK